MKCLVFGSLNIDHVYQLRDFVRPGETVSSMGYERFCGGKGFNQAIALSRAGAQVFMAGACGEDGTMLREVLREEGIDMRFLQTLDAPTGHAVIQVNSSGQNCILIHAGANGLISRERIDNVLSFFSAGDWLVLQNEISNLDYLIIKAHERGLRVVLNPSPFDKAFFTPQLLRCVDLLIVNESEGADLTGKTEADDILRELVNAYPHITSVLTLGTMGSIACCEGEIIRQPAYLFDAVDTTAAGDTYTGYLLSRLIAGASLKEAMNLASLASGISVTRKGASSSVPYLYEVKEELKKH